MKHAKRFFLFFFLGLLPLPTWACKCGLGSVQQQYDHATVIVLVNARGNIDGNRLEVLRSWKMKLPKRIDVLGRPDGISCVDGVGADGIYLLYLDRNKQGKFSTKICSGNLHESASEFRSRIDWLNDFGIAAEHD